jgi:hypothetical protein
MCLDTSVFVKGDMGWREYLFQKLVELHISLKKYNSYGETNCAFLRKKQLFQQKKGWSCTLF